MSLERFKQIEPDIFPIVHNLERLSCHWFITARRHEIDGPVLEITAFTRKRNAAFRVFTTAKRRYSQTLCDMKWGGAKVSSLYGVFEHQQAYNLPCLPQGPFLTAKSAAIIKRFLADIGEKPPQREIMSLDALEALHSKQNMEKSAKSTEKARAENLRSRVLENRPQIPDVFLHHCETKLLPIGKYLFYKSNGKHQAGYCLCCGQDVEITETVKHRKAGVCPNCGETVTVLADGLGRNKLRKHKTAGVLQKGSSEHEFYLTVYYIAREYDEYRNLQLRVLPMSVSYFNIAEHRFLTYNQKWASLWCGRFQPADEIRDCRWTNATKSSDGFMRGILKVFKASDCKNTSCWRLFKDCRNYGEITQRMKALSRYPAIEYFMVSGFATLFEEMSNIIRIKPENAASIGINLKAKSLPSMFGLEKQELHDLRSFDPGWLQIAIYKKFKNNGYRLTIPQMKMIFPLKGLERLYYVAHHVTPQKIINYVGRQYQKAPELFGCEADVLQVWVDYMQEACKYHDLRDPYYLYPKDLPEFHRKTDQYGKYMANHVKNAFLLDIAEKYKEMEYGESKYLIRPAKGVQELISEGSALKHCAADYPEYILRGKCMVFFLRLMENPEKPFVTVEYKADEHKVKQISQSVDEQTKKDVTIFLGNWLRAVEPIPAAA